MSTLQNIKDAASYAASKVNFATIAIPAAMVLDQNGGLSSIVTNPASVAIQLVTATAASVAANTAVHLYQEHREQQREIGRMQVQLMEMTDAHIRSGVLISRALDRFAEQSFGQKD